MNTWTVFFLVSSYKILFSLLMYIGCNVQWPFFPFWFRHDDPLKQQTFSFSNCINEFSFSMLYHCNSLVFGDTLYSTKRWYCYFNSNFIWNIIMISWTLKQNQWLILYHSLNEAVNSSHFKFHCLMNENMIMKPKTDSIQFWLLKIKSFSLPYQLGKMSNSI